jgi:hypothetical protein
MLPVEGNEFGPDADGDRVEMNAAYVEAHAIVIRCLAEIDDRIHDLPAPESNWLAWKHVGVMNRVKRGLRAVVASLADKDQQGD